MISKILQILGLLQKFFSVNKTFFFLTVGQNNFDSKIPFSFEFFKYLRYITLTLTKRLMLFGKGSCVIQSSKPTDIKYNHRRQNYLKNKFKKCQVAYYKVFMDMLTWSLKQGYTEKHCKLHNLWLDDQSQTWILKQTSWLVGNLP